MNWVEKVQKYCADYNIPIEYLADTLYEPKVVPMIRGKAFEFSVVLVLQQILSPPNWDVVKLSGNRLRQKRLFSTALAEKMLIP